MGGARSLLISAVLAVTLACSVVEAEKSWKKDCDRDAEKACRAGFAVGRGAAGWWEKISDGLTAICSAVIKFPCPGNPLPQAAKAGLDVGEIYACKDCTYQEVKKIKKALIEIDQKIDHLDDKITRQHLEAKQWYQNLTKRQQKIIRQMAILLWYQKRSLKKIDTLLIRTKEISQKLEEVKVTATYIDYINKIWDARKAYKAIKKDEFGTIDISQQYNHYIEGFTNLVYDLFYAIEQVSTMQIGGHTLEETSVWVDNKKFCTLHYKKKFAQLVFNALFLRRIALGLMDYEMSEKEAKKTFVLAVDAHEKFYEECELFGNEVEARKKYNEIRKKEEYDSYNELIEHITFDRVKRKYKKLNAYKYFTILGIDTFPEVDPWLHKNGKDVFNGELATQRAYCFTLMMGDYLGIRSMEETKKILVEFSNFKDAQYIYIGPICRLNNGLFYWLEGKNRTVKASPNIRHFDAPLNFTNFDITYPYDPKECSLDNHIFVSMNTKTGKWVFFCDDMINSLNFAYYCSYSLCQKETLLKYQPLPKNTSILYKQYKENLKNKDTTESSVKHKQPSPKNTPPAKNSKRSCACYPFIECRSTFLMHHSFITYVVAVIGVSHVFF